MSPGGAFTALKGRACSSGDLQQQLADRDAQVEQLQAELLILRGLVPLVRYE